MSLEVVTLRIDKRDMRIFRHVASLEKKSLAELLRELLAKGYFYKGIQDISSELKTLSREGSEREKVLFETVLEMRNIIRLLAVKLDADTVGKDSGLIASARERAVATAKELLAEEP
jgi:hypothetical protein